MSVTIKRAYEKSIPSDGCRILVDGLWPRGISRDELCIDAWMRAIAPSANLRKWYGHEAGRWKEFRARYRRELGASPRKDLLADLTRRAKGGKLTLVFGARDADHSNAAVISEMICENM